MQSSVWRRASIQSAALVLSGVCVLAGGGCQQQHNAPPSASTSTDLTMPPDKLKAIGAADATISKGDKEIDDGQAMKDTDPAKSAELIKQGEADKAAGEAMRDQAYQMK